LEAAASNTGESLVDLTLREGEWFLDKMIQISGLSVELAQVLAIIQPHSDLLGNAINCLVVANAVFRDLEVRQVENVINRFADNFYLGTNLEHQ
jgi:hypothetical protein